jgi:hypothetical protein
MLIVFLIHLLIFYNGENSVDEFVLYVVQDEPMTFSFVGFAEVIVSKFGVVADAVLGG